jgi:hypothetical protein
VGAEDHGVAGGHVGELFDEDGALGAQAIDDEAVVHDLVADVDRGAEEGDRPFDDLDGPFDAGAEAAGVASKTSMVASGLS